MEIHLGLPKSDKRINVFDANNPEGTKPRKVIDVGSKDANTALSLMQELEKTKEEARPRQKKKEIIDTTPLRKVKKANQGY